MEDTNQEVKINQVILEPSGEEPVKQNGFLLPILGVLLIVLVIGAGAYYLGRQATSKPQTDVKTSTPPTSIPDETVNWKTYTGDKYRFKHPSDWNVTTNEYLNSKLVSNKSIGAEITFSDQQWPFGFGDPNTKFETQKLTVTVDGKEYNIEETIVNNSSAFLNFKTNSPNVVYIYATYKKGGNYQDSKDNIVKILSTFQFFDQNQVNENSSWKTYQNETITFKFPSEWTQKPILSRGSGFTQEFEDPKDKFYLTFWTTGNYSQVTGKPYANIDEYINMSYQVKTLKVDGREARQPLPRAGSENINSVVFFSKDSKFIYTLELRTGKSAVDASEADIKEGQKLFDQILATFKFSDQASTSD